MINLRILVIDDMPNIHEDFRKILQPEKNEAKDSLEKMNTLLLGKKAATKLPSFEIDFAYQGEEGINYVKQALARQKPYAVAFIDVQMPPGMDGIEAIQRIWKLDPEIQIVICTAYAKYSWDDLQQRFGETDRLFILKKPFDQLEILNLASTLTKRWNLNQSVNDLLAKLKNPAKKATQSIDHSTDRLHQAIESLEKLNEKLKGNDKHF